MCILRSLPGRRNRVDHGLPLAPADIIVTRCYILLHIVTHCYIVLQQRQQQQKQQRRQDSRTTAVRLHVYLVFVKSIEQELKIQ